MKGEVLVSNVYPITSMAIIQKERDAILVGDMFVTKKSWDEFHESKKDTVEAAVPAPTPEPESAPAEPTGEPETTPNIVETPPAEPAEEPMDVFF